MKKYSGHHSRVFIDNGQGSDTQGKRKRNDHDVRLIAGGVSVAAIIILILLLFQCPGSRSENKKQLLHPVADGLRISFINFIRKIKIKKPDKKPAIDKKTVIKEKKPPNFNTTIELITE